MDTLQRIFNLRSKWLILGICSLVIIILLVIAYLKFYSIDTLQSDNLKLTDQVTRLESQLDTMKKRLTHGVIADEPPLPGRLTVKPDTINHPKEPDVVIQPQDQDQDQAQTQVQVQVQDQDQQARPKPSETIKKSKREEEIEKDIEHDIATIMGITPDQLPPALPVRVPSQELHIIAAFDLKSEMLSLDPPIKNEKPIVIETEDDTQDDHDDKDCHDTQDEPENSPPIAKSVSIDDELEQIKASLPVTENKQKINIKLKPHSL